MLGRNNPAFRDFAIDFAETMRKRGCWLITLTPRPQNYFDLEVGKAFWGKDGANYRKEASYRELSAGQGHRLNRHIDVIFFDCGDKKGNRRHPPLFYKQQNTHNRKQLTGNRRHPPLFYKQQNTHNRKQLTKQRL